MVFNVNGVNILPFVAYDGLKWQRSDLDGENAGRTLDGIMHRDRIATKVRWDVTCKLLTAEDLVTVLNAIQPEFVEVEYTDPFTNTVITGTFYSNNVPMSLSHVAYDGTEYWNGLAFPLIER